MKKKRKYIRKRPRTKLIESMERILYDILVYERGERCEICGGTYNLGLFHILPKGEYPRIRFYKQNLLIAGWYCCHFHWHHNFYTGRDRIIPRIKELRGENFEEELRALDITATPLTDTYLRALKRALEKELKQLETSWQKGGIHA